MSDEVVSVLTLSRNRPQLLLRAIASVCSQDYEGPIEHVVVVDDCPETFALVRDLSNLGTRRIAVYHQDRAPHEVLDTPHRIDVIYPRIARLVNQAASLATGRWIALLDDDNEYEPEHIRTLVGRAHETGCLAVHSSRRIFFADGRPYLEPIFPWTNDEAKARQIYEIMCSRGVWVRSTNILHDRAEPLSKRRLRNSTILTPTDSIHLVDTSVWLLDRELMLRYPVPHEFTEQDFDEGTCPDDKHLEVLMRNRVRIASTGLPTLRYYLGGYSNGRLR